MFPFFLAFWGYFKLLTVIKVKYLKDFFPAIQLYEVDLLFMPIIALVAYSFHLQTYFWGEEREIDSFAVKKVQRCLIE